MSLEKEADVCIIASGAGGAPVAYALGKAGFSVVVLEAGPRYKPEEYHLAKKDWEQYPYPQPFVDPKYGRKRDLYTYSTPEKLNPDYKGLRSWSKAQGHYNTADRRRPPHIDRAKGVGGTTLHYQGEVHRFSPFGFETRSLYEVADDWPITYQDLEPYYDKAERLLGVAGLDGNPFKPPKGVPFPIPPMNLAARVKG